MADDHDYRLRQMEIAWELACQSMNLDPPTKNAGEPEYEPYMNTMALRMRKSMEAVEKAFPLQL